MKTKRWGMTAVVASVAALVLFSGTAQRPSAKQLFEQAVSLEETKGDLEKAIEIYKKIAEEYPGERALAAQSFYRLGVCYEKMGMEEAEKAFQKVINDFPDQGKEVKAAKEKLSALLKARTVISAAGKELSVRLVWADPEAETVAEVSPDGKYLSFIDQESGNLCIKELSSGNRTVVVRKREAATPYEFPLQSYWSPDGKRLAFGWLNKDISVELRIVNIDGSETRTLYRQPSEMAFPVAWSPDGNKIAVNLMKDSYKSYSLALVSVGDGSVRTLKSPKLLETAPKNMTFSPDGRYLVVDLPQKENDARHDIFAFSVEGTEESRIVEHQADDYVLDWIPGSDALLFLSDRTGTLDAWAIDIADGRSQGEPRLVRKNLGQVSPLGISREGALFYGLKTTMMDVFMATVDLERRDVIERPKMISMPLVGANHQPQWSPDGRSLAFFSVGRAESGKGTRMSLWLRSAESGEVREIDTDLLSFTRPCWAPDGRSIFVIGSNGKTYIAIHRIDIETGRSASFVDSERDSIIKFIAPSPDGKSVFYTYFEFGKKRTRIMSVDLATRETRELYRQTAPPDIGGLSVSPDGSELVFGTLEPDDSVVLTAIPFRGGPPREIIRTRAGAFGVSVEVHGAFCWTPDGKHILFFRDLPGGKKNERELCYISSQGGDVQGLGLVLDRTPVVFSLHPDGRRLAFSASRAGAEIWVMENFLPEDVDRK